MKKVLVFPLLKSMPSGHHQVADAICESIYANSSLTLNGTLASRASVSACARDFRN